MISYMHPRRLRWPTIEIWRDAGPPASSSLIWNCPRLNCQERRGLLNFPCRPPNPALHVAGCSNKVVLQFHLGQAAIARVAQTVRPDQFALRALDSIAMFHALFESLGVLLLAAGLQRAVMLPDCQGAMSLVLSHTLVAQRAVVTLGAELKAIAYFSGGLFHQAAALGC